MNSRDIIILLGLSLGGFFIFNFTRKKIGVTALKPFLPEPQHLKSFIDWQIPESGKRFATYFNFSENRYSLPKNILARMAYQESRFRNDIITGTKISPAGAVGIMQIIPRWHPEASPLDPAAAIDYAGKFLQRLYRKFGSWPMALAGYNWGEGNLQKWVDGKKEMPKETQNYMDDIINDIGVG